MWGVQRVTERVRMNKLPRGTQESDPQSRMGLQHLLRQPPVSPLIPLIPPAVSCQATAQTSPGCGPHTTHRSPSVWQASGPARLLQHASAVDCAGCNAASVPPCFKQMRASPLKHFSFDMSGHPFLVRRAGLFTSLGKKAIQSAPFGMPGRPGSRIVRRPTSLQSYGKACKGGQEGARAKDAKAHQPGWGLKVKL